MSRSRLSEVGTGRTDSTAVAVVAAGTIPHIACMVRA